MDADSSADLALTADEVVHRKRLVGLGEGDARRIRQLGERLRPRVGELVDEFFRYLSAHEEARGLTGRRELLEEVREKKRRHLDAMFAGEYGVEYAAQRLVLGRLYSRAELPMRLFLGAYHHVLQKIGEAATDAAQLIALQKLACFDISLSVDALMQAREHVIVQQQDTIRRASVPVLQLHDRLLLVPVIGVVDHARARLLTESVLHAARRKRARVVVMDVTGVVNIDTRVAHQMFQTVTAARLMGVRVIVSGLSPEVSHALSVLGVDVSALQTATDLQGAIEAAERMLATRAAG